MSRLPTSPERRGPDDPRFDRVRRALASRAPTHLADQGALRYAAVVLMLRPGVGDEMDVLLVRRAERESDPWSGHIALPGGRRQDNDASLLATALRETLEETAVDLAAAGEVLGELDEVTPKTFVTPPIIIRPFVAVVGEDVGVHPNHQLAAVMWTPLSVLTRPEATDRAEVLVRGTPRTERVFRVGDAVIWGLTERILRGFLEIMALETGAP